MDRPIKLNGLFVLLFAAVFALAMVYGQDLGGGIQQPSSGGGGGGGVSTSLRRVTTAADTMTTSDGAIVCSAASNSVVETTPPSPAAGQTVEMKRVDSTSGNNCTLAANTGQTIENQATVNVPAGTAYTLRWESSTNTWWIF